MKIKALFTVLSEKYRKGRILFVEELALKNIKTKDAVSVIKDFLVRIVRRLHDAPEFQVPIG